MEREWIQSSSYTRSAPARTPTELERREAAAHRRAADRARVRGADDDVIKSHIQAADILDPLPVPHVPSDREIYARWAAVGGDGNNRGVPRR